MRQKITEGVIHDQGLTKEEIESAYDDQMARLEAMARIEPHNFNAIKFAMTCVNLYRKKLLDQLK